MLTGWLPPCNSKNRWLHPTGFLLEATQKTACNVILVKIIKSLRHLLFFDWESRYDSRGWNISIVRNSRENHMLFLTDWTVCNAVARYNKRYDHSTPRCRGLCLLWIRSVLSIQRLCMYIFLLRVTQNVSWKLRTGGRWDMWIIYVIAKYNLVFIYYFRMRYQMKMRMPLKKNHFRNHQTNIYRQMNLIAPTKSVKVAKEKSR